MPPSPLARQKRLIDSLITPRPLITALHVAAAPTVMSVSSSFTTRAPVAARVARPAAVTAPAKAAAKNTALRVAIVHDWLIGGGAELVVEQLHGMFPEAPIYTSYCTREWRRRLDGKVKTGVLQLWPFSRLRKFIPVLRIWWFGRLNLRNYDLVLSSSGAEAKAVHVPPAILHINYCHTPTHYYWSRYQEYLVRPGFGAFDRVARLGLKSLVKHLRRWDYKAAQRPDYMIANSSHTKAEIQKYYDRSATVIHPPVFVERFRIQSAAKRRGFVIAGRQTPYKRFDLAIKACTKLNLPLTVIGNGPEHRRLRRMAGPSVTFLGKVSDEVMAEELAAAKALLFPGTDDFGIVAVEALAAGTPVIAFNGGGALDYVIPGKTGVVFDEQTTTSLARALRAFSKQPFDHAAIRKFSERFSRQQFRRSMRLFIKHALQDGQTEKKLTA